MNSLCRFLAQSFMRIAYSAEAKFLAAKAGWLTVATLLWIGALPVRAESFYVATNGNHTTFTNWTTAATNIQDAVNVATNDDIVLVSNGVYTTTTGALWGSWTNIVALTNQIILKSVNGPAGTVIDANYPAQQRRGVYISKGTLDGFTVRNGYVNYSGARGGGIYIVDANGTVTNCIVHNNYADSYGGGFSIRSATGIVANCMIYSNSCTYNGGGMEASYLSVGSMVNNCVFWKNKVLHPGSPGYGGGGLFSYGNNTVKNCLFYQNDSYQCGGGVYADYWYYLIFENCTITANTASNMGGGFYMSTANTEVAPRNSIIYNNSAGVNYADAFMTNLNILTNSCIRDTNGVPNWDTSGNITNNPRFVDAVNNNYRLLSKSPCVNTGTNLNWMTNGVDLDNKTRIRYGKVDRGAYEKIYEGTVYGFR